MQVKEEIIGALQDAGNPDPEDEEDDEDDGEDSNVTTLQFVKELRAQHLGRELPTFSPYSALESLIEKFKGKWRDAAEECLDKVKVHLHELALSRITEAFNPFPDMRLRVRLVRTYVENIEVDVHIV